VVGAFLTFLKLGSAVSPPVGPYLGGTFLLETVFLEGVFLGWWGVLCARFGKSYAFALGRYLSRGELG